MTDMLDIPKSPLPKIPYKWLPLVFAGFVLVILGITWPWAQTFSTGFIRHWDPPFHAWKLELVARAIMDGNLLPPNANTNMYYPHSGALYYEALHWPQAVLAAFMFHFTDNPVLVYHLVLVAFWALSGVTFWMMLLALRATHAAALFGALVFIIMPYRISYMVEFNMQLNFALPLFFFYMIRYFEKPTTLYACGMALALWLQAVSELYQAVFLAFLMPFFLLAFWPKIGPLLKTKTFWMSLCAAGILFGILTYVFLWPYETLLSTGTLERRISEIKRHSIEPFSYLRTTLQHTFIGIFNVKRGEMTVYPTATLIALSFCAVVYALTQERFNLRKNKSIALLFFTGISLLLFFVLSVVFFHHAEAGRFWTKLYAYLPRATVLLALVYLLLLKAKTVNEMFMKGLFGGAVFSFFMSLGPFIAFQNSGASIANKLYVILYKWLGALQGFRVVSRFSIFLLMFMIIVSALLLSAAQRRYARAKFATHVATLFLYTILLALIAAECIPKAQDIHPIRDISDSSVMRTLDDMDSGTPYVLAVLPMGDRNTDSRHMMQIAGHKRLFVYAWGGTYPELTTRICKLVDGTCGDPEEAVKTLGQLWPECYLFEDIETTRAHKNLTRRFKDIYAALTDIVAEDDQFVLMRLKPDIEPEREKIRLVRQDFVDVGKKIVFTAHTPDDAPATSVVLFLNDKPLGTYAVSQTPQTFSVELPKDTSVPIRPNVFKFVSDNCNFVLQDFEIRPAD